jgi:hypothetical protein
MEGVYVQFEVLFAIGWDGGGGAVSQRVPLNGQVGTGCGSVARERVRSPM